MCKVYCSECQFLEYHDDYLKAEPTGHECVAPVNLGDWYARDVSKKKPWEMNRYNNCVYFKPLISDSKLSDAAAQDNAIKLAEGAEAIKIDSEGIIQNERKKTETDKAAPTARQT